MSNESLGSGPVSDTVSPTKPPPLTKSETECLAHESCDAKKAIEQTIRELNNTLKRAGTEHPFLALGAAAVTGGIAVRALVAASPNGEQEKSPATQDKKPSSLLGQMLVD